MNQPNPFAASRAWQRWALLALLLAAFALRLYRLDLQDVWWDEARNIDVASRALTQIATAGELDIHPPIYFYLLHAWMAAAGRTAFAIRLLSTLFGVLFVALMYALGRRAGGPSAGLFAALGAGFLPFLLGEAQEARMYTVTLAWLAAAAIALLAATGRGDRRLSRRWLAFSVFSALALLTHYSALFALVALWAWADLWALVAHEQPRGWPPVDARWVRPRRVRTVALSAAVAAALCLPGLPVALRQVPGYRNTNLVVPSVESFLADLARVYTLGEHYAGPAARPLTIALVALLGGGALLGLVLGARRVRGTVNSPAGLLQSTVRSRYAGPVALVLMWAVLPLVFYYLAITDRGTFATRYISVALPAWLLLAALAMRGWSRVRPALGAAAALGLVLILAPGLHTDLFDETRFRDDTRGVIAWLRAETDPQHDIILVDQRYPFGFYYERWNNLHGAVPPPEPAGETPAQYLFVDVNTLPDRLTELGRGRSRIYWVRWWESDTDPRGAVLFLLDKFGTRLGEEEFRGYKVTWYEVAPDTRFELARGFAGPQADFGGQVRLEGVDFGGRDPGPTSTLAGTQGTTAAADSAVWAVARWARLPAAAGEAKATLLLEDADGVTLARDDRLLLNDRHVALGEWSADERPLVVFALKPAAGTPPGRATLKLSVYDPRTLAPLPVTSEAAAAAFVVLGHVDLAPASAPPEPEALPLDLRVDAAWGEVTLLGRGPLAAEVSPGDTLAVDLYWQSETAGPGPLQFRVELSPVAAATLAGSPLQDSAAPVGGRYPSTAWRAGEVVRQRASVALPPALPGGAYRLVARPLWDAGTGAAEVVLGEVQVVGRGHDFTLPAALAHRSGAEFGPAAGGTAAFARLLGFDEPVRAPRVLGVRLYWQALSASPAPYAVSVQVLDARGVLVAQADQQPGAGAFPTHTWVAGEVLADAYEVQLPAGLAPGSYTLIVKMYDPSSGEVVPAVAGEPAPQEFVTLARINLP